MTLAQTSRRLLRTAQTFFPQLRDYKYRLQTQVRQLTRRPFEYEFRLLEYIDAEPDAQLVDVGANQGQSIQAIRMFMPQNPIICFEANSMLADRVAQLYRGDENLQIHACGLGESDETETLYVPQYRGYVFDGLASFSRAHAEGWLNEKTLMGFRKELLKVHSLEAKIRRLDDFDVSPLFIKIDVQGWELSVVKGGEETLRRCKPIIFIEAPDPKELIPLLERWGYANLTFHEGRLRQGHLENYRRLFIHEEARERVAHLIA